MSQSLLLMVPSPLLSVTRHIEKYVFIHRFVALVSKNQFVEMAKVALVSFFFFLFVQTLVKSEQKHPPPFIPEAKIQYTPTSRALRIHSLSIKGMKN